MLCKTRSKANVFEAVNLKLDSLDMGLSEVGGGDSIPQRTTGLVAFEF